MLKYAAGTIKGKKRDSNEDRVLVNDTILSGDTVSGNSNESCLLVICDGVGSNKGGAKAAEMILHRFTGIDIGDISPHKIGAHLYGANKSICSSQNDNSEYKNMASTVAGVIIYKRNFIIFNVGDTRVYRINNDGLTRISEDHTSIADDFVSYKNTFDTLANQSSNLITRYIGGDGRACLPSIKRGVFDGSREFLLLCTDGAYKNIPDDLILESISTGMTLEEKVKTIMQLSLQNGSSDDISVGLIEYSN